MSVPIAVFLLIAVLGFIYTLVTLLRCDRPVSGFLHSATWGLGSLGFIYALGYWTGPLMTLSPMAIGISVFFGMPGVISILFLRLLWGI